MSSYKRILLTTSAAPSQSPFFTSEKRPPLGVGFLISVLRNAGHEVFFIDNYLQPSDFLDTDYLQLNQIDFVGIYANTICYRDTLRMLYKLEYLRLTGRWKGKIIIGGPHTTVALNTIPEFVDYVVQGEGEYALLDIVEGKATQRVMKYPRIQNLDELPMPAFDYFVTLPYNWHVEWFPADPVFTMNTSRGCPFQCTFCSVGSIWGKNYTYFSAERIVADIEFLVEHHGAKGIYFREDNFTLKKKRLIRFCNLLLEKRIEIPWACETRVSSLDQETVGLMSKAGACGLYFGVESGSQRMLDFFKKGITVEQTRKAFSLCHEYGIKTAASVVVGAPTETDEDRQQTLALLDDIKPTTKWFNVFVGIPNSNLYRYVIDNNLYEFIDDRGLVYLKDHNERTKKYYGGQTSAEIPLFSNCGDEISKPKISVLMSVYNGKNFLEKAIQSIIGQSFIDFEFIIIDDASTDSTPEILAKLTDPRLKILCNRENLGLTKSLNIGIKEARGEFIARMDADDISLPHRFGTQYNFLKNNPEYALVGSSYYSIDENGKILSLVDVLSDDKAIRIGLQKQNWFGHGTVMVRKSVLITIGGYDEEFLYAQDYDLWLRIAEKYKMANIKEPLYCWRLTPTCISKDKEKDQKMYAQLAISKSQSSTTTSINKSDIFAIDSSNLSMHKLQGNHSHKYKPTVSIIVPTYNRPNMLKHALKSILVQTFQDFEIIVVNDCGWDVEPIISDLNRNKNKILYVKHARNRGLAAARNTGIRNASGQFIALLDDDDIFYPDHLETAMGELSESQGVIYTNAVRATYRKKEDGYQLVDKNIPYSIDYNRNKLLLGNISPVNCFVFDRNLALQAGLFDETLSTLEDWDFWIRLSALVPFKHISKPTVQVNWRTDGTSMTTSLQSEFKKNREAIYSKNQAEINGITNIEDIMAEFEGIWSRDVGKSVQHILVKSGTNKSLISIIILTFNQLEYTKMCVKSIQDHSPEPHEIIFVDNGSTDGTRNYLQNLVKSYNNIKIILNDKNLGFAAGNNQAIQKAGGDYILLLNNDVVVTENWLDTLICQLNQSPDIGMVGPMSNSVSGPQQAETATYGKDMKAMQRFARNFAIENAGKTREILRLVGFCLLIKRNVLDIIGGLDENYCNGNYEDDDLCLRSRIAGFRNIIACDVFIHHYGSMTFKGNAIDYQTTMQGNLQYFANKWRDIVEVSGDSYMVRMTREDQLKKLIEWGEEHFSKGNINAAVKIFERVLKLDWTNSQALNNIGVIQWQLGDVVSAMGTFQTALANNPKDADALGNLMQAAVETERFNFIKPGILDAVKMAQPDNPDVIALINAQHNAAPTASQG